MTRLGFFVSNLTVFVANLFVSVTNLTLWVTNLFFSVTNLFLLVTNLFLSVNDLFLSVNDLTLLVGNLIVLVNDPILWVNDLTLWVNDLTFWVNDLTTSAKVATFPPSLRHPPVIPDTLDLAAVFLERIDPAGFGAGDSGCMAGRGVLGAWRSVFGAEESIAVGRINGGFWQSLCCRIDCFFCYASAPY